MGWDGMVEGRKGMVGSLEVRWIRYIPRAEEGNDSESSLLRRLRE